MRTLTLCLVALVAACDPRIAGPLEPHIVADTTTSPTTVAPRRRALPQPPPLSRPACPYGTWTDTLFVPLPDGTWGWFLETICLPPTVRAN